MPENNGPTDPPGPPPERPRRRRFWRRHRWTILLLGGVLLFGLYGYAETLRIEVVRVEVALPRLDPSLDGSKLILLSDIHTSRFGPRERRLQKVLGPLIRDEKPFAVLIAGDLRFFLGTTEEAARSMEQVFTPLSLAHLLVVRGNHDRRFTPQQYARFGAKVLDNVADAIAFAAPQPDGKGKARSLVMIAGVRDPHTFHDDLDEALKGVQPGAPVILLAHSPEIVPDAVRHGVDLVLCGHTHGGQVRLPFVGAPITMTRPEGAPYVAGLYRTGSTQVYVTRGIGWTFLPVRLRCRPEVTVLTLHPAR